MTYKIQIGGSPSEFATETNNPEDAEQIALEMAWDLGSEEGISNEDIDVYGEEDEDEWGACPEGSTGAYWPVFRVEED